MVCSLRARRYGVAQVEGDPQNTKGGFPCGRDSSGTGVVNNNRHRCGQAEISDGIADLYAQNPWTKESTASLLRKLGEASDVVERHPDIPPWNALWSERRIASFTREMRWSHLDDFQFGAILGTTAGRTVYWSLTHEDRMQAIFDRLESNYQETARQANHYELAVSAQLPWESLEKYYESCELFVRNFEAARPMFRAIPPQLQMAPEIKQRL